MDGRNGRGRPALFGTAGAYERAYAWVSRATKARMVLAARARGVSLSRLLHEDSLRGSVPATLPPAEARVYVQLPMEDARRLRAATSGRAGRTNGRRHGWALADALGAIAEASHGQAWVKP